MYPKMTNPIRKLKLRRRAFTWAAAAHLFGNPSAKMKVVGVTGTNGKTTTAMLLYRVAEALGHRAGLIGTVVNKAGKRNFPAIHTTPDPLYLNTLLREMLRQKCEYVFMEVSSHALDQKRTVGVKFAGGIFTNLTHDHLDYHKNLENYFKAKKKLFEGLSPDAFALSNADDGYGARMLSGIRGRKFFYGFENRSDFFGKLEKMDFSGLTLLLNGQEIRTKLLGKFNAYNLLAVASACQLLGFEMKKVAEILENIEPPPGRFEHFLSPAGALVVIDYAHTPDALEKVLLTAREIKSGAGRLISVFGCGGDRDPLKRSKMGKIGAELSDIAIFTSDNPRSEDPNKIIEEMRAGVPMELSARVKIVPDRREAIRESLRLSGRGDIILCAGKGHEDYQEVNGKRSHFNDIEEYKKHCT